MAKQLLNGQKIVVVRCEALNISGEFFRAKRTSNSNQFLFFVEEENATVEEDTKFFEGLVADLCDA